MFFICDEVLLCSPTWPGPWYTDELTGTYLPLPLDCWDQAQPTQHMTLFLKQILPQISLLQTVPGSSHPRDKAQTW